MPWKDWDHGLHVREGVLEKDVGAAVQVTVCAVPCCAGQATVAHQPTQYTCCCVCGDIMYG
jgi:hypothetical protein